jgi:hypothetical protein
MDVPGANQCRCHFTELPAILNALFLSRQTHLVEFTQYQ